MFLVLMGTTTASQGLAPIKYQELVLLEENTIIANYNPNFIALFASLGDYYLEDDIKDLIRENAPEMADLLISLNECENYGDSVWRCGDNGKSCGPFQMRYETFKIHCINEGIAYNWYSTKDQIICSADMIKEGWGPTIQGWQNCWINKNLFRYGY